MRVRISVRNIRNGAFFIRKHFISVGYDYSEKITLSHGLGENLFGVRIENNDQGSDVSRRFRPVEKTLRFFRNISVIRNGQTSRILPRTCRRNTFTHNFRNGKIFCVQLKGVFFGTALRIPLAVFFVYSSYLVGARRKSAA